MTLTRVLNISITARREPYIVSDIESLNARFRARRQKFEHPSLADLKYHSWLLSRTGFCS